jgi:hypothetical protein
LQSHDKDEFQRSSESGAARFESNVSTQSVTKGSNTRLFEGVLLTGTFIAAALQLIGVLVFLQFRLFADPDTWPNPLYSQDPLATLMYQMHSVLSMLFLVIVGPKLLRLYSQTTSKVPLGMYWASLGVVALSAIPVLTVENVALMTGVFDNPSTTDINLSESPVAGPVSAVPESIYSYLPRIVALVTFAILSTFILLARIVIPFLFAQCSSSSTSSSRLSDPRYRRLQSLTSRNGNRLHASKYKTSSSTTSGAFIPVVSKVASSLEIHVASHLLFGCSWALFAIEQVLLMCGEGKSSKESNNPDNLSSDSTSSIQPRGSIGTLFDEGYSKMDGSVNGSGISGTGNCMPHMVLGLHILLALLWIWASTSTKASMPPITQTATTRQSLAHHPRMPGYESCTSVDADDSSDETLWDGVSGKTEGALNDLESGASVNVTKPLSEGLTVRTSSSSSSSISSHQQLPRPWQRRPYHHHQNQRQHQQHQQQQQRKGVLSPKFKKWMGVLVAVVGALVFGMVLGWAMVCEESCGRGLIKQDAQIETQSLIESDMSKVSEEDMAVGEQVEETKKEKVGLSGGGIFEDWFGSSLSDFVGRRD